MTDFDKALQRAEQQFKAQFDHWAFDERDSSRDLQFFLERDLGRKLSSPELKDQEFLDAEARSEELEAAAYDIGFQRRVGTGVSVAIAEEKFQRLK